MMMMMIKWTRGARGHRRMTVSRGSLSKPLTPIVTHDSEATLPDV